MCGLVRLLVACERQGSSHRPCEGSAFLEFHIVLARHEVARGARKKGGQWDAVISDFVSSLSSCGPRQS